MADAREDLIPILAEVFRARGFEGTSLSAITAATGLGKGSLYHAFPGGKDEMAAAVLAHIEHWFETEVFAPLRDADDPWRAIAAMFAAVDAYFKGGGRVCIVGLFALDDTRDRFAADVKRYFALWIAALRQPLEALGYEPEDAQVLAEDAVGGIQGALVLARSLDDRMAFRRLLKRLEARLLRRPRRALRSPRSLRRC